MRGLKPVILEKDYSGRHASGVNAGGVRQLGRALPEIPLAQAALKYWHNIVDLVDDDCGFATPGQIKVAEAEKDLDVLKARQKSVIELGYNHEEIIDQQTLRELLPALIHSCVGGMIVRGDGHANPFRTAQAFKRKAISLGTCLFEESPVTSVKRQDGNWHVRSTSGDFEAPIVINCAGAWGGRLASMLGEVDLPIDAQALMLMITAPMPPFIKPVIGTQGRTLSFKQYDNGTVMIGGGYQGKAEPEHNRTHIDFRGLSDSAKTATSLFPIMRTAKIVRCWAGIEGEMPDKIPVIGPGTTEGVYHAFGFCGHGFAISPIVGKILADIITTGNSEIPIDAFSVDRFT